MERSAINSMTPFSDTSTNINEIIPEQNNITSVSSPTNKTKRNKLAITKPSLKSHPSTNQSNTSQDHTHKSYQNHPDSEKQSTPTFFARFKKKPTTSNTQPSIADNALKDIIHDLDENPVEEDAFKEEKTPPTGCSKRVRDSRKFLRHFMEEPNFHYTIIVLIMIDLIIVFVDLIIGQLSLACLSDDEMKLYNTTEQRDDCLLPPSTAMENGETALFYISFALITIFVLEIFSAFYAFGWRRYTQFLFFFDAFIVLVSFVLEVYFHYGSVGKAGKASAAIVVLRMWKIIRAIHAVAHAVTLRNHLIIEEIEKAREIVNEEKHHAQLKIDEQQEKINYLTDLLDKYNNEDMSEENNSSVRNRAKSFDMTIRL